MAFYTISPPTASSIPPIQIIKNGDEGLRCGHLIWAVHEADTDVKGNVWMSVAILFDAQQAGTWNSTSLVHFGHKGSLYLSRGDTQMRWVRENNKTPFPRVMCDDFREQNLVSQNFLSSRAIT